MTRRFALVLLVLLVACIPGSSPRAPIDPTMARGSLMQMAFGVTAAAEQCTAHARWLESFGGEQEQNAERLFNVCVNRLGPARDAVVFAADDIDPWTPRSGAVIGCTGKTVHLAMQKLNDDFALWRVKVPNLMVDAIKVATWAEQWAEVDCDPEHPRTRVQMFEDPAIPRVEPNYPPWPEPITLNR